MKLTYKEVYDQISNNCLLELLLPEDKNFISKTREFQEQIKHLDEMVDVDDKYVRNIYFLSSEMIQAVIHNGVFNKDLFTNCVRIYFNNKKFYLLSQNLVNNDKIVHVKMKFDEVNSAFDSDNSEEELMLRYKYKMKNAPMTKAGISVGVLDLARRSLNKLLYDFEKVDDQASIFSIICTVDLA